VEIIARPRVEQRPERVYVGIRLVTPFRGMLKVRDELLREARRVDRRGGRGPDRLRLHAASRCRHEGPDGHRGGLLHVEFDRREAPEGDAFACRYEANLTDPEDEPRKTRRP
jgi:hypothetical protein